MIKSLTAREIFCRCPQENKNLLGGVIWTGRYFAITAGKHGNEETNGQYVKNQVATYQKLHEDRQVSIF